MSTETRRDQLNAAFDQLSNEDEKDELQHSQQTDLESKEIGGDTDQSTQQSGEQDDKGGDDKDTSQETEQRAADRQSGDKTDRRAAKDSASKSGKPDDKSATVRVPSSWKGAERAHWDKIPREAQLAIDRREREITKALQSTAGARQFTQQFLDVVNPFAHLIRAQNSTPLAAVKNLMTTAAGLAQGNSSQKAAIVAEICSNYGIDLKELDAALGNYYGEGKRRQDFNAGSIDPRIQQQLAPVQNFMSQVEEARQRRAQEIQEDADYEVSEWSKDKDFFTELREDMADIMDFALEKGKRMTLDQAYERALADRPDLKQVVDQKRRAKSNAGSTATRTLERARAAASSISGAPNGGGGNDKPVSRRDHLMAAWDKQQN